MKTVKKTIIMLGVALAWAVGGFTDTHEGVQLLENGPLWAETNVGANSPGGTRCRVSEKGGTRPVAT